MITEGRRRCAVHLGHRRAAWLAALLALSAGPVPAQQWIAGDASWYDLVNWDTGVLPAAGGFVVVGNGGTARLNTTASGGATSTPALQSLTVGAAGIGAGAGTVRSVGVGLQAGFLAVGSSSGLGGSFASGLVETTAAGATAAAGVRVGTLLNQATPTAAAGTVLLDGTLAITAPAFVFDVAQMFDAGAGSVANGRLVVKDLSGTIAPSFLIVGNVTSSGAATVGNRAGGELVASDGGLLTLAAGVNTVVGTTFGSDRVADAGGTRINEATGTLRLAGTVATAGDQGTLLVGRAFGGRVDGTVEIGTLVTGSDRFAQVAVGTSTEDGIARGRVVAGGSGDLRHQGALPVGRTTGGTADGTLEIGGALRGNGFGSLSVGTASGSGGRVVQAQGSVTAAGGVAGERTFEVGVLSGDIGAGSSATGRLVGVGDAGSAGVGSVAIGRLVNTAAAGSTDGEMRIGGALGMAGGFLDVGQVFGAATGSTSRGVLHVGGDLGSVTGSFLIVGNVTGTTDATVGNRSFAELVAGGATLEPAVNTIVGTTFGIDRVSDASGTRINEATGTMRITGTLATAGDQGTLLVGRAFGGRTDGTLEIGQLSMGSNRFSAVEIGTATTGEAVGRVEVGGGALRAGPVRIGFAGSGSAAGSLALQGGFLDAESVLAGQGAAGSAVIALADSLGVVATDVDLGTGLLQLDRSLLTVGEEFRLGAGATLRLGIEGLARGTGYGAIDTMTALLGGELALDFSGLLFGAASMVFDLIVATDPILGDFESVSLLALDGRYQASTGIFDVGDDDVYRLTLTRLVFDAPEPGSRALVAVALLLGACAGRRRRRACR